MSRDKTMRRQLSELHDTRRQLLRMLTASMELAVGTVSIVKQKCGKPTCRCATAEGHPKVLFLFASPDGHRRCKLIRRDDEERLLAANERYREFREGLRQLQTINQQEKQILLALQRGRAITYT